MDPRVISSSLRAVRRVSDKTRSPRAVSAVLSAEPMRPEAPDIRIFMIGYPIYTASDR